MADANTLTPCPFCGERAETYFIPERQSYQIECSDVFGCTARVTRDSEQEAIEAWNLRSPSSASQPVAATEGPFPVASKRHGAWDGIEDVLAMPDGTDIYTASQVQAMLAAAPRNATLYNPDDVAFPVQRSADGTDAPTEPASIAAAEVAAPIAPAREPLTDEQIDEIHLANSDAYERGDVEYESHGFARAIEHHHGIK